MTNNIFNNSVLNAFKSLDDSPAMRAILAIDDSPALKTLRELSESPVAKAMRQLEVSPAMQTILQLESSAFMRTIRDFEAIPILNGIEQSPAYKTIQQLQDSPAIKVLQKLEHSPSMTAFSRITDQVASGHGALTFCEAFALVANEHDNQKAEQSLDLLTKKVHDLAEEAPDGFLSADFCLNLTLALVLFCFSQMSANESEGKLLARFESLEKTISTKQTYLDGIKHKQKVLVSDRSLYVRSGPGMEYDEVGTISRNQKLIELERNRDWAKVEYFDHINNKNISGWSHSRYLLTINPGNKELISLTKTRSERLTHE